MNLMNTLMKFATPEMAAKVAGMLGVNSGVAQKLIAAAVPMVLSAILGATKKPGGADAFGSALDKVGSNPLDSLGATLDSDPAAAAGQGNDLLSSILGGGTFATMASKLADYGDVPKEKSSTLLGLAGSLAMGGIGRAAQEENLDAPGALRMLEKQKDDIAAALPSDFAKSLEGTGLLENIGYGAAPAAAASRPTAAAAPRVTPAPPPPAKKTGMGRWLWLLVALAILAWLLPRFFASEPEVVEVPVVETPPVAEAPVADVPVADAPVADAPVADAPVADAPVADAPVADAPVADAPVADAPVADEPVAEAPAETAAVPDVDYLGTVQDALGSLTGALTDVTDTASAEAALPTLNEVNDTLAEAQGAAEAMPAESRTALQSAVSDALPEITTEADRILADGDLASLLRPVLDGIVEKLQAFAG